MKTLGNVLKFLAALAVVAGAVYAIVTYGDKIVAWTKKLVGKLGCCCCQEAAEAPVADAPAEEIPQEADIQAEETDFEG